LVVALAVTANETASKPAATVVMSVFMGTSPLEYQNNSHLAGRFRIFS
jgi:hypothetical protein